MVLCVLKHKTEADANVDIPKLVVGLWPRFDADGGILDTLLNISLTLHNHADSPCPLTRCDLLFPFQTIAYPITPISGTLLDETNPITVSYTGLYRKTYLPKLLRWYDGVGPVYVDTAAELSLVSDKDARVERLQVRLSSPLQPGQKTAVRLLVQSSKAVLYERSSGLLITQYCLSDPYVLNRIELASLDSIEYLIIPRLRYFSNNLDGGFDVFFHIPIRFSLTEYSHFPEKQGVLNYDCLGRPTEQLVKRFVFPIGSAFGIQSSVATLPPDREINAIFEFRTHGVAQMTNFISNSTVIGGITVGSPSGGVNISVANSVSIPEHSVVERSVSEIADYLNQARLPKKDNEDVGNALARVRTASKSRDINAWSKAVQELSSTVKGLSSAGGELYELVCKLFSGSNFGS